MGIQDDIRKAVWYFLSEGAFPLRSRTQDRNFAKVAQDGMRQAWADGSKVYDMQLVTLGARYWGPWLDSEKC